MTHWIIRVKDGVNFRNSVYPIWGVKRKDKKNVTNMKPGDILWFCTSKPYGSKFIGMGEYCRFYDRNDEPLLHINTKTNKELGWTGDELWDIHIHYSNLYNTEKKNIHVCIPQHGNIFEYEKVKHIISDDLYKHYDIYNSYFEPKIFTSVF